MKKDWYHHAGVALTATIYFCKALVRPIVWLFCLVILATIARAVFIPSLQIEAGQPTSPSLDREKLARQLAGAVRFRTIPRQDTGKPEEPAQFVGLRNYLRQQFPLVHQRLKVELISDQSLLYTWRGTSNKKPVMLISHTDVVPAEEATLNQWKHPPFSGHIDDTFIWGRGTLDDKNGVIGILAAVEELLRRGFRPERTVYLGFGQDEEVGGVYGAQATVKRLQARNVSLEYLIDEGMIIADGMVPGVNRPVAIIGIAEKGYLSLELTAVAKGGHASMPPRETAVGKLAAAVAALEANPFEAGIEGVPEQFFRYVAPEMNWGERYLFSNQWLFKPLIEFALTKISPETNALVRTTIAPTMLRASPKENVLAKRAVATVNFRISPNDTVESVIAHVKKSVGPDISVRKISYTNRPSAISSTESFGFQSIQRTIGQTFGDIHTAPNLMIGAADATFYQPVSDQIFRFLPVPMTGEDTKRLHSVNERISKEDFARQVEFYLRLIENSAGKGE